MYKIARGYGLLARPLDVGETLQDFLIGELQLHIGNARAETFMRTVAEGEVFSGIFPRDVKAVRVREDIRVAVS